MTISRWIGFSIGIVFYCFFLYEALYGSYYAFVLNTWDTQVIGIVLYFLAFVHLVLFVLSVRAGLSGQLFHRVETINSN